MAERYLMKYKGTYRVLCELDRRTNDFPRDHNGEIDDGAELYISCQFGNKIMEYGTNSSRRMLLTAYIPSLGRGRNIKKELKKQKVEIFDYDESDEEVMFHFLATDITPVAELLKAKVSGASISPWSKKNLPKATVDIPEEGLDKYKAITSKLGKTGMLLIKTANQSFLDEVLAKKLREKGKRKPFDYAQDMRQMKMSRMLKEYIWVKGLWEDYIDFLRKEINKHIESKE